MASAILNLDVEKSAVTPFNSATVSCIVSRIVPLNVDKNGGMFCGGCNVCLSFGALDNSASLVFSQQNCRHLEEL